jgi:hypothetical protein
MAMSNYVMKLETNTCKNMENNNFAVFIMVHDRPDNCLTYKTLKRCGYSGKMYLVIDNDSPSLAAYQKLFGDMVIPFNKKEVVHKYDGGDNSGDLRSTMYKANEIFNIAKSIGVKYFCLMCDDYYCLSYRYHTGSRIVKTKLDQVFEKVVDFYKNTNIKSIAFSQGGDHIGGFCNRFRRKAMNSFFCSTDRPFEFVGRLNEDVTTYVNLGTKGEIFCTLPYIQLDQKDTQKSKSGLTDVYKDNGTYVKSFFSVMYNPSCVKISVMNATNKRIHHTIKRINMTPMIINQQYKKI